jgi:hypothetical protein
MSVGLQAASQIEETLANGRPFGDPDYIWDRLCLHYEHRVRVLGDRSAGARRLDAALVGTPGGERRRVLGDPAVRIAIDRSLVQPTPEVGLETILETAAASLAPTAAATPPPLAERAAEAFRIREDPWPWVWSTARDDDDPLGDFIQHVFTQDVGTLRVSAPDSRTHHMLIDGARLLSELLPRLAASALSHVHTIVVVDESSSPGFSSLTHSRLPGIIFLSPNVLKNPWQAAEYLLHEAMHVKFTDLEHTHSLLSADYDPSISPTVHAPWNRAPAGWPINRSLTVLHVYTCLALFFTVVTDRHASLAERYGPLRGGPDPAKRTRRSFDRAHYLRRHLALNQGQLDTAGRLLVRWLGDILRVFDPAPPPEGACVHLLLDLYDREASTVRALRARLEADRLRENERWAAIVRDAARSEIGCTLDLLPVDAQMTPTLHQHVKRVDALDRSNASLRESADAFLAVRQSVFDALKAMPTDPGPRDDIIRTMVENSGARLNDFLSAVWD